MAGPAVLLVSHCVSEVVAAQVSVVVALGQLVVRGVISRGAMLAPGLSQGESLLEGIEKQKVAVAEAKPDKKALKELDEKIQKLTEAHEEAVEKSETVEIEVRKINAKIKEVMGSKVRSISKKLDDTRGKLDKLKKELTRLEVEIGKAEREAAKSQEKVEAYEAEVKECEEKMRSMNEMRQQLETKGVEAIQLLEKLKEDKVSREEEGKKLEEEIEGKKKEEAKFKSQQLEINQVREDFDKEMKDQTKNCAHWKREVKKLKLRSVPGEDGPTELVEQYPEEELKALDMKKWQYELNLKEEKLSSLKVSYRNIFMNQSYNN